MFQICPSEVELVLRAHAGIDDCAVVGRQDHVTGEVPAAFVVKNAQHPLLASAEVRQYVSGSNVKCLKNETNWTFKEKLQLSKSCVVVCFSSRKFPEVYVERFWDETFDNSGIENEQIPK